MDETSFRVLGPTAGNSEADVVQPVAGKVFPLMFLTGFLGIFFLVNIRRMLIIDFRLPWPSSTATGQCLSRPGPGLLSSTSPSPLLIIPCNEGPLLTHVGCCPRTALNPASFLCFSQDE